MDTASLELSHISAFYGHRQILNDVSLDVKKGKLTCLLGRNGAGKSTLLKILAGLVPNGLRVMQNGVQQNVRIHDYKKQAQTVAFLSQSETCLWNYSVFDLVLQGRFCHTNSTAAYTQHDFMVTEQAIERLHIEHLKNARVHEISGGEFQKVRLARCLAQDAMFILLDEPLASLDFSYEADFILLLKELCHKQNCGIIMSVHDINAAARYGDILALITQSKNIITGSAEQILSPAVIKEAFGKDITQYRHPDGTLQIY